MKFSLNNIELSVHEIFFCATETSVLLTLTRAAYSPLTQHVAMKGAHLPGIQQVLACSRPKKQALPLLNCVFSRSAGKCRGRGHLGLHMSESAQESTSEASSYADTRRSRSLADLRPKPRWRENVTCPMSAALSQIEKNKSAGRGSRDSCCNCPRVTAARVRWEFVFVRCDAHPWWYHRGSNASALISPLLYLI